ncbi:MAG: site-specific integrase [Thermoleophilia bacterium]
MHMLDQFLGGPPSVERLGGNPLAPQLASFAAALRDIGHSPSTVHSKLRLLLELGRWLGRNDLQPRSATPGFFVSERGTRITDSSARYTFAKVSQEIGLRKRATGHGRGPRLHDLRHRFAARTLIGWYRAGLEVERELPKLATYLGHVHINETYWYIEAVPELLQLACGRLLVEPREVGS